jgi:predicted MPP superfamily phosphohydrolase
VIGHNAGNLVFAVSGAVDTAILCAAVVWAVRDEPAGGRLLIALVPAVGLLAVKGVVLLALGVSIPFGVLHVVWLDLVVALPLAALLLLALTWRRRAVGPIRVVAVAALCLAPLGAYASFVEPERLVLERATLELDPAREGERQLRIGVLADLQCEEVGAHEREAVERLMAERPDIILLPGDYHQGDARKLDEQLPALRSLMRRLDAPGGVFAVQGDVEGVAEARRVMAGTGVRVLVNRVARVEVGDRRLTIAGIERDYWSEAAGRTLAELERRRGEDDIRIALTHRPDAVRLLPENGRVDLTVAGHTHGGQVQLPLIGPLRIASGVPREVGAGGLHELDGRPIYVSRGVGAERAQAPRLRFGAVPEVSLITLR